MFSFLLYRALATVIGVQWVLCTANFVSIFLQLIKGFVHPPFVNPDSLPPGVVLVPGVTNSTIYFDNQSSPEHIAQVSFYIYNVNAYSTLPTGQDN